MTPTHSTAHHQRTEEAAVSVHTTRQPSPAPDLSDELWTNAHLARYFACGTTKVIEIKRDPAFPPPVRISGLQRYPANQVRAYALAQQTTTNPTTTQGAQP
jgi:hypothetical protein